MVRIHLKIVVAIPKKKIIFGHPKIQWSMTWITMYLKLLIQGPKDSENVFEEEELQPYCKFCFAKRYKISALNVQETVTIV